MAHFARDRDNRRSTDASRAGLGITLWQKQNDDTIRPIAFAIRYLIHSEKNYSIEKLELLAVVWRLDKNKFYLHGNVFYLYADHQAIEALIKRH